MTRMWMASLCCALLVAVPLAALSLSAQSGISKKAHDLHFRSIVIDTHDDTTQRLLDPSFDLGARHADGNVDIPRMREGGLNALFFSIYIPGTITGPEAVKRAIDQIDAVRQSVAKHPKDMLFAASAADINQAHLTGQIAALMGVEGGHMIANDLGVLRIYATLGVRYVTLTHYVNTDWADSSTDKPVHNGLTDFGKQVVREMNRLGVIVDVSHVSDKTFYDALAVSQAPMIASHSSCRALCDTPRNMTDDMIRALAAKGGVIQINYHVGFLSQQFREAEKAHPEVEKRIDDEVKRKCGDKAGCEEVELNTVTREAMAQGKLPRVEWTAIVDHIDHAVKLVGADHVGLGSDFDGAVMPFGMDSAADLPKITDALLKKGYSDRDIQKILGGNTVRLMEAAEATARKLQGEKQ
jgi:membrane dipeptidase